MLPLFPSTQPAGSVLKCVDDEPMDVPMAMPSTMPMAATLARGREVNNNQQVMHNMEHPKNKQELLSMISIETNALDLSKA